MIISEASSIEVTDELDASSLEQFMKKRKLNYEERLASIMEGREGRDYGSKKRWKERTSKTNREKQKSQPIAMQLNSARVRSKSKRTSRDVMVW
jgi:protein SDA1